MQYVSLLRSHFH